jgi:putative oxidoreductase
LSHVGAAIRPWLCEIETTTTSSVRAKESIDMNTLIQFGPLLGRILIALIYLASGFGKISAFAGTVAEIASKGLPLPQVVAIGAIIVELGCGTMLIVGWKARSAAVALFVFTALAGLLFHNFWAVSAAEAPNQMTHFLKNICILGGLLQVIVYGSGPLSIDGVAARPAP